MWEVIKKVKWWMWIGFVVAILLIWQYLSGWAYSRKLYDMALDNLRTDQTQAIEEREEQLKLIRGERDLLKGQIKEVQKEKEAMRLKAEKSEVKVIQLEGENDALRKKINSIVVSDDPDRITDDLNKMGYGPIERVR